MSKISMISFLKNKLRWVPLITAGAVVLASPWAWSQNACFVDASISCTPPSNAAQIVVKPLYWSIKSTADRQALFASAVVQNDPSACLAFAQILKTECALQTPVTAVFTTGPGKPMLTMIALGFDTWKPCRVPYPDAFTAYFRQPTASGYNSTVPICRRTLSALQAILNSFLVNQ